LKNKLKEKRKINYKGLLYVGCALIALGVVLNNYGPSPTAGLVFLCVGGLFLMISFKNKKKWDDSNQKKE
jgi:Ca2+/Na+ antiporter